MNLQDCFAAVLVGQVDHNPAIEAARPEQGLVQNVGLDGRRQNDDAFAAREPVHLGQNLIERLLLLARSADRGLDPGASYSLDFVDEDDRSDEPTSELQSLIRSPYPVSC